MPKNFSFENAWAQYVSPGVVENLIENPEKLQLGGERVDASYIFTDIAGFTSLAETISPEKLASILNRISGYGQQRIHCRRRNTGQDRW